MTDREVEARARTLVSQMTLDEKLALVRSHFFMNPLGPPENPTERTFPPGALGTAGYVPGIARLGVPAQQQSDASLGVAPGPTPLPERTAATALPASIALAASWNSDLARAGGEVVGREARAFGINVMLAGGVNLARDSRCGRNFEYLGEDPLLAGVLAGAAIKGIQSEGVVSTVKHFALNAQETGRNLVDEVISEDALRESDLLAFQIAIERGRPGAVMTAYNKVNGAYCSQNSHLIKDVLKGDWAYPGWVMSDWGSVHSTREAALAGLDQQSGTQLDPRQFFDEPLRAEVASDPIVAARLDDMVTRMMRSMVAAGLMDQRETPTIDISAHRTTAQRQAEEGIVLLTNRNTLLPLTSDVSSIAIIGPHADVGVLAGGGSSCVIPEGSLRFFDSRSPIPGMPTVYHPSSPVAAFRGAAPSARVAFSDGADRASAVQLARGADVAIVFADRWDCEGGDAADLSLPNDQDALIAAIAAANARTIVVLQTGGPVLMPWADDVGAILAAWYPGQRGAEALADIVFGAVNPSGRLPLSFPANISQLPRPTLAGYESPDTRQGLTRFGPSFTSTHVEGADVGYRWQERNGTRPLFPFGFGLSYTTFALSDLVFRNDAEVSASVCVSNTGARRGKQVVQLYARPPGAMKRLVAFAKVELEPGESKALSLRVEPRLLAHFDVGARAWRQSAGDFEFFAGFSSADLPLSVTEALPDKSLPA